MSRYQAFFIGFLLASLMLAGALFFMAMDYIGAGFDCADQTPAWETCASAARTLIVLQALGIAAVWASAFWLLLRERKKR